MTARASSRARPPLALVRAVRSGLARNADPARAAGMRAYLKSAMPLYGVPTPLFRRLCREAFAEHPLPTRAAWRQAVAALWSGATHREERHAAIELAGLPRYRRFESSAILPLYRRMIVGGAWWDLVDALAKRVGSLLARDPARMAPVLRRWARDRNLWIRRSAIIAQIGFRQHTDAALLHDVIQPSLESREFFLRKAIGWALREHAKADPDGVARYLRALGPRLSPLSRREAEKGLAWVRRHGRLLKPGPPR